MMVFGAGLVMKFPKKSGVVGVTSLFALSAAVSGVQADEPVSKEVAAVTFDEIVVTATRRETGIQTTGLSISAFGGEDLDKSGYTQIGQFVDMVPGVTAFSGGPNNTRVIIRNIATSPQDAGSATIATYLDDVALGRLGNSTRIVDVERVEVLKGPQGTLFGRSAMGGIVRYISNKAHSGAVEGGLNIYGADVTDGGTDTGGHSYLNVPLTDTLAVRAVGFYYKNGGFLDNTELGIKDVNDEETYGGRLALHWDASENLSFDLTYMNQKVDAAASSVTTTRDPGDRNVAGDEGPDILYDLDARTRISGAVHTNVTKQQLLNLKMDYEFSSFTATALATRIDETRGGLYDQREFVGILSGCVCDVNDPGSYKTDAKTDILELRLVSKPSDNQMFDWILGAYYEDSSLKSNQKMTIIGPDQLLYGFLPLPNGSVPFDYQDVSNNSEIAAYAEVGVHLGENTTLTAGYRRSHIEFDSMITKADGVFLTFTGENERVGDFNDTEESVDTYKLSLEHNFSDNVFGYVTATSGYRRGGFNAPTAFTAQTDYQSDNLWNYEAGIKSTLLDGRLIFNLSAYRIDYTDMQLVVEDPVSLVKSTQNVGNSRIIGVESLIAFQVLDYLDISFNGSLSDAKLRDDIPGAGIKKDDKLPGSARENFSVQANWDQPWNDKLDLFVNITYKYTGARNNSFNLDLDDAVLDSYQLVDTRLGLRFHEGYTVSLYAHNLFDEKIAFLVDRNGPSFLSIPTNRPRTVGLNVTYDF